MASANHNDTANHKGIWIPRLSTLNAGPLQHTAARSIKNGGDCYSMEVDFTDEKDAVQPAIWEHGMWVYRRLLSSSLQWYFHGSLIGHYASDRRQGDLAIRQVRHTMMQSQSGPA
jgi:hypothetical protein